MVLVTGVRQVGLSIIGVLKTTCSQLTTQHCYQRLSYMCHPCLILWILREVNVFKFTFQIIRKPLSIYTSHFILFYFIPTFILTIYIRYVRLIVKRLNTLASHIPKHNLYSREKKILFLDFIYTKYCWIINSNPVNNRLQK